MSRTKLIVAVWKEKLTFKESSIAAEILAKDLPEERWPFEIAIAPSPLSHVAVRRVVESAGIRICAQNILWGAVSGSYIGEVTSRMLLEVGCDYVIVGHSERRSYFSEGEKMIAAKAIEAINSGIIPIICFGENPGEKASGASVAVVKSQLESIFANLDGDPTPEQLMLAYEPVWAISTSRSDAPLPSGTTIQEMHGHIREIVAEIRGAQFSEEVSVLYGGSVDGENGEEYLSQPDIDGALVGGASKTPKSFLATLRSAKKGLERRSSSGLC